MDSKTLRFTKMHGLGNDFVVIDGIAQKVKLTEMAIAHIANRHLGVGCDQLLLIEPVHKLSAQNSHADFSYRIFNADGGEVGQCGNGARCVAKYLFERVVPNKDTVTLHTSTTTITAMRVADDQIRVEMGVPRFEPGAIPLIVNEQAPFYTFTVPQTAFEDIQPTPPAEIRFSAVSLGNPHAVICVDDYENLPLRDLGTLLSKQPLFPQGVNVGFMIVRSRETIELRVVERGAGGTLACGSGACAAMVVAHKLGLVNNKIKVHLLGGELTVEWEGANAPVWMTGPAVHVFDGVIGA